MALSMDAFPTVLEAAGVTANHQIEGQSFLSEALGESSPEADTGRVVFFSR